MKVRNNKRLSKCKNKTFMSHKKLSSVSPIPGIMLFSSKSCTDRELLRSPKCRNLNRKLNIT